MFDSKNRTDIAGMTKNDCAKACSAERCVISGRGVCMHPMKSSMGAVETDPAAAAAYASACQLLGINKISLAS
jgi:hypothetical protein